MKHPATCPALAPPPPVPPIPRAPAAAAEPSPDPPRRGALAQPAARSFGAGFLHDVIRDLRHMVWPSAQDVEAATLVVVGLLSLLTIYIAAVSTVIHALLRVAGVN